MTITALRRRERREARPRVESVALGALRDEWEALLPRARTRNIFVSWTFLATWWEHFRRDRDPRVFVVRDDWGAVIGIVPLYVDRVATRFGSVAILKNIGYGDVVNPDFLDAIVEEGREDEVATALEPVLFEDDAWEYGEFSELAAKGSLIRMARLWERRGRLAMRSEQRSVCPYIELPESYDAYLAGRNPHFRQQVRRYRRKLHKDFDVEWWRVGEDIDVAAGIESLARLHQERMEATERGGNFKKDDYLGFHRDLAERLARTGELFFWVISIEGAPAATHYGFLHDGVYYGYQMGFSLRYQKYSPGHTMTGVVMEKLIARGAREMNLLRGTDAWKFRWTDKTRRTATLRLMRPTWASEWANVRAQLSGSTPLVLRFLIGRDAFDELRHAWKRWRALL